MPPVFWSYQRATGRKRPPVDCNRLEGGDSFTERNSSKVRASATSTKPLGVSYKIHGGFAVNFFTIKRAANGVQYYWTLTAPATTRSSRPPRCIWTRRTENEITAYEVGCDRLRLERVAWRPVASTASSTCPATCHRKLGPFTRVSAGNARCAHCGAVFSSAFELRDECPGAFA